MEVRFTLWLAIFFFSLSSGKPPIFFGEEHYPGYIPLEGNFKLFYWFFRARNHNPAAPFVIWLQGGPGCAGTGSALGDTGPYNVEDNLSLTQRQDSINDFADVLFVDQPLGTGFSNCSVRERIPKDEESVGKDMVVFLTRFLDRFPELKNRNLYLLGQSYAGHYVPALAKCFLDAGFPVKGAAINNGWYHPFIHIRARGVYAYTRHLCSLTERILGYIVEEIQLLCVRMKWWDAVAYAEYLIDGLYRGFGTKRFNEYDTRVPCEPDNEDCFNSTTLEDFLNNTQVREELGVGDRTFDSCNATIEEIMVKDIYSDISPFVTELLDKHNLKIIFYSGEYDFVCDIEGQDAWIQQLEWKYKKQLNSESWRDWYISGKIMGKYKAYKNVIHAIVYDSGHIVPYDQPLVMMDALYRLIYQMP